VNRCVDPVIPNMDFKKFARFFIPDYMGEGRPSSNTELLTGHKDMLNVSDDKVSGDSVSLLSSDSGILVSSSKGLFD